MKLGIVPLCLVYKEPSSDVHAKNDFKSRSHFYRKSHWTKRLYIIHGFFMILGQNCKWTSLECSIHADHNGANPSHNGANPSFVSHSWATMKAGREWNAERNAERE